MTEPVRIFTDNPSSTLAWIDSPGGKNFYVWLLSRKEYYTNTTERSENAIHIHRAQGALEVVNTLLNLRDIVLKHERSLREQAKAS